MIKVETTSSIENLVAEMRQLSDEEQRALAGVVLKERSLEPFVEELEDYLSCERAEGDPEELIPLSSVIASLQAKPHRD